MWKKIIPSGQDILKFKALEEGTFARDLVSEPGNVLHPDEYAKRLNLFKKDGLKVNIYDEKLKKLGIYALLGVGHKKVLEDHISLQWNGVEQKIIQDH